MNLSLTRRAIYAIFILALFLGLAEAAARVAEIFAGREEPEMRSALGAMQTTQGFVRDHHLFWKMKPNARFLWEGTEVVTNSHGLRDDEFPMKKPRGEIRVLCLGESGTFGEGVAAKETYSERLEAMLAENYPGRRFQVINAGVPSCTSFQGMVYLRREGLAFEPDLVIPYFFANDHLPSYFTDRMTQDQGSSDVIYGRGWTDREVYRRRFLVPGWTFLRRAAFVRLLSRPILAAEHGWKERANARTRGGMDPFTRLPVRVPDEDRRFAIEQMARLTRWSDVKILLLIPPYGTPESRDKVLPEEARRLGAPLLDLWRMRTDYEAAGGTGFFLDGLHPSAEGHRICAEAIFRAIKEKGLLPLGDRP